MKIEKQFVVPGKDSAENKYQGDYFIINRMYRPVSGVGKSVGIAFFKVRLLNNPGKFRRNLRTVFFNMAKVQKFNAESAQTDKNVT